MDHRSNPDQIEPPRAPESPERLGEVLKMVKLELVSASVGARERGRGFNPYDGRLGSVREDLWGRRRRV
jgi:hypothetical protein